MNEREQEIKSVANKLLQGGIAKSHMDAMKMAESMVQTDMKPSGKRIDNLQYADPEPESATQSAQPTKELQQETIEPIKQPEYSMPPTYNIDGGYDASASISELTKGDDSTSTDESDPALLAEVKQELENVEETPNSYSTETAEIEDSVDESAIQEEIAHIWGQEESSEGSNIEQELAEPEQIRKENELYASPENSTEIKEQIQEIESEPESNSHGEDEVEQELAEPEILQKEEQYRQEEEKELEDESHSDIEVVDIDDSESDEITNLF